MSLYIEYVPNKDSYRAILLRSAKREGKRIVKKTVLNITEWNKEKITALSFLLKGNTKIGTSTFKITRSLPHGAVLAILGTMEKLGFPRILAVEKSTDRNIAMGLIAQRIIAPSSKVSAYDAFTEGSQKNTLSEMLGLTDIKKYQVYESLDYLFKQKRHIEKKLAKKHLGDYMVLYDLTSIYYEGETCPLTKIGRDKKGNYSPQILVGLLTNSEGVPIGTEVFKGNLLDHQTLLMQIKKIRKTYGVKKVIMIGDRGTIISKKIEEIKKMEDVSFITALTAPQIKALTANGAIQLSLFDQRDLAEITDVNYPNERLVACRNPQLQKERSRVREELLLATEKELSAIVLATQRKRKQLTDKGEIGVRVGKVINKFKMAKHFTYTIDTGTFSYHRNISSIEKEALLDGVYVIRTTLSQKEAAAEKTVEYYKNLAYVERSFRCMKTTDLDIGPIYHSLEERVKTHVFLCMLSYYVEYFMRKALSPLLFQEEDSDRIKAQKERVSIVAKAVRSEEAKMKDKTRMTEDKRFPVQSFKSLLLDLATLTQNTIEPEELKETKASFKQLAEPTDLQKQAFDYLQVSV
jgi:transposase